MFAVGTRCDAKVNGDQEYRSLFTDPCRREASSGSGLLPAFTHRYPVPPTHHRAVNTTRGQVDTQENVKVCDLGVKSGVSVLDGRSGHG